VTGPQRDSALSLLTFREVRGFIRRSHCIAMTVFFGLLYGLGSMVLGGMLVFTQVPGPSSASLIWSAGSSAQTWNYPAFVFTAPWGYVVLPFLATIVTILVSAGVAMGTSVAILLTVTLLRRRRLAPSGPTSLGTAAGLTPAMLALLTLGACCGTTAAATAGIGVVAQITGTSADNLLFNNWFLGLFQVAVVWIALLAQELLLRVYGDLIGVRPTVGPDATAAFRPPRFDRRFAVGALVRAALLVGGVTWSLAMLVAWTTSPPGSASPTVWASWLLQYELVGFLAILAALFPEALGRAFARLSGSRLAAYPVRGLLLLAGLSLAVGTPAPLAGAGFEGLGNEVVFLTAGAGAWGAAAPVFGVSAALLLRWLFDYVFLGGFAIAVALVPRRALAPLGWTVGTFAAIPAGRSAASGPPAPDPVAGVAPSSSR
jgi:hypothetical protein